MTLLAGSDLLHHYACQQQHGDLSFFQKYTYKEVLELLAEKELNNCFDVFIKEVAPNYVDDGTIMRFTLARDLERLAPNLPT